MHTPHQAVALLLPEDPVALARRSRIDAIAAHTADGTPITLGELLVLSIARGDFLETASAIAGANVSTVRSWLRLGRDVAARRQAGAKPTEFTAHQRRCERLAIAVAHAAGIAEARINLALDQLSTGATTRKVTRRWTLQLDKDGNELDRQLVSEVEQVIHHPPDARVLMWRAERRFANRWRPRPIGDPGDEDDTDIDGPDDAEDPVAELDRQLTAITERKAQSLAALEAAGIHVDQHAPTTGQVIDVTPPTGRPDDTPL